MSNQILNKTTVVLVSFLMNSLQAQVTLPAAGGEFAGKGGSVSITFGQVACSSYGSVNGSMEQGVQNSYDIVIDSGSVNTLETKETLKSDLLLTVFPNPTTDQLVLKIKNFNHQDLIYKLFDINGKLLMSGKILNAMTPIGMHNYLPSAYFLTIIENNKELMTYKIIKN